MTSLRQLLAAHSPALLLDASSARIQVGILAPDGPNRWAESAEEAGVGLFRCVQELGHSPTSVSAYIFCEGPGSILGVRTVAMAIRSWGVVSPKPVFAYGSLALLAHALGRLSASVIADARRDSWHRYRIGDGLRRVTSDGLTGELVMPAEFRHWSPLPAGVTTVPYSVPALLSQASDAPLFHPTDAPDAFLHEEPSYVTWTPRIHRAPSES
ncbi:MAG TPA: peptidase M22 [Opitutaceae bacterium]|nr:peptidase M22 [Opitutaceae bacterium]